MRTTQAICLSFNVGCRALDIFSPVRRIFALFPLALLFLLAVSRAFAASTINFAVPSGGFKVVENGGSVSLTVLRTNDTDTTASVDFASSNLLATAGHFQTAKALPK